MKTLGLVGGTGWVSTQTYYRLINRETNARLGGLNSARLLLYSVNYEDIYRLNQRDDHEAVTQLVADAARRLALAGAEGLVLCANTLHMYAERVAESALLPLVHIGEATAAEARRRGYTRVGLMGTRPTMERAFYRDKLAAAGVEALIPDETQRAAIHHAIFDEILKEVLDPATRARLVAIVASLAERGAEAVVLGCTEIPLLVRPEDTPVPLLDTLAIHARAAVDFALSP